MKLSDCSHIRIRDKNDYGFDVEEFIESIEKRYQIDFRSMPQWKELIKRLHVPTTDFKRKVQDANQRKYLIMNKLLVEATRNSPFELTDKLARTYHRWNTIKFDHKIPSVDSLKIVPSSDLLIPLGETTEEISRNTSTAHHNTEIPDFMPATSNTTDTRADSVSVTSHLPVKICLNRHKLISINSQEVFPECVPDVSPVAADIESNAEYNEWLLLNQTTAVKCFPKEITVTKKSINEQIIKFSITNFTTEYLNIRFMCLTNHSPFKTARVVPETPRKLYLGIALTYKFIFKLVENLEEFSSMLYFRVGQKIIDEALPVEALCIPIKINFSSRSVSVTEAVNTPPAYLWHIREVSGFPSGSLKISSHDDYSYHVQVIKRLVDLSSESQDSIIPLVDITEDTESITDGLKDSEIMKMEDSAIINTEVIATIVEDLVDLALDTFILDRTYLYLKPRSNIRTKVYFTKADHIGSHHCYYDVKFSDSETEEHLVTKTVQVFAEVLPHPIQINPRILDMSRSPVTYGYCEDDFIICNNHKFYPVTIKVKLTTKMRKLFRVTPMETLIPSKASVDFKVRICSKDISTVSDDFVHFTIKIVVTGPASVYGNVPPFYYEIIAPCASDFKKIYNSKYFKDI